MKKFPLSLVLVTAFLGMGLSMPSCPGQQAMQQQIDTLTADNANLRKTILTLDGQVKAFSTEMDQSKQLFGQITTTITAQKSAIDQLNASLKELQEKMVAMSSPKKAAKPTKKKTH